MKKQKADLIYGKNKYKNEIFFSDTSTHTLDLWTGGYCYKALVDFELFGIKIVIWRKK